MLRWDNAPNICIYKEKMTFLFFVKFKGKARV